MIGHDGWQGRAIVMFALGAGCYSGSPAGDDAGGPAMTDATVGAVTDATSGASGSPGPGESGGTAGPSATGGGDSRPTADDDGSGPPPPLEGPLLERLEVVDVELGAPVAAGARSWRIWGTSSLGVAPVFTVPRPDCGTLVGTTADDGGPSPRVVVLDADDAPVRTLELPAGRWLRGLAVEDDGHFGALLWDDDADRIWLHRFDLSGAEQWSTELTNPDNRPDDFEIGDSRLEYGAGRYGAYYHVHSDSGHEGDTLKWVDAADGTVQGGGWGWGCSHSMSNVLRYSAAAERFMPACVTDCFPGTSGDFAANSIGGIYLNHNDAHVIDVAAGCNGSVAGELGSAALTPEGWALVFNAHQAPARPGQDSYDPASNDQDIGLTWVGGDLSPSPVVWLTSTDAIDEDDASIARWSPAGDAIEQYVVGWHERGEAERWWLARIDGAGDLLEGPVDVSAVARWGRRDDPFRRHRGGDVGWSWFDAAGSTTLYVARLRSGVAAECPGA